MARILPNGGSNPFPKPPVNKPSAPNSKLGSNPGLITSTGGLFGTNGRLLIPAWNPITGKAGILLCDPSNFNCEDNCEYDFPQIIPEGHEGEDVTCHLAILKFREIGIASFNLNITSYQRTTDSFITVSIPVNIPPVKLTGQRRQQFPDQRIHTLYIYFESVGERPQPTITSNGGSGQYSIVSLIICGNADQTKQK